LAVQPVSGTVGVTGSVSISNIVGITGGYLAVQPVSGTVGVTGSVSISNVVGITGTVNLGETGNTIKIDGSNNLVKISDGTDTATVTSTLNETNIKGVDTNAYLTAFYRNENANSNLTSVNPTGADGGVHALDTYSYISGLSDVLGASNRTPMQISATYGGSNSIHSLDTYVRNEATTNFYGKAGINMYNIYPKKIYCNFGGYNGNNVVNQVLGGPTSNTMSPSTLNWSSVSTLYYWIVSSASIGSRKYIFTYVDLNNTIQSGTVTFAGTAYTPLLGVVGAPIGMRSLLTIKCTDYIPVTASINIVAVTSTATPTNNNNCIAGLTYHSTFNGAIVVPNGYVGYLTHFNFYSNIGT
ncbi:MAG: hypothetical protein ACOVOV_01720, partial [Dolichospermum sp.]